MTVPQMLLAAAALCVVWAVVSAIQITHYLDRRGSKTPFSFMGSFFSETSGGTAR